MYAGPYREVVTSVCGPKIFLEYLDVKTPLNAMSILDDMNDADEMPILEKVVLLPSGFAEVYARFPSGTMMYESRVRYNTDDTAVMLAREYFQKYIMEHHIMEHHQ